VPEVPVATSDLEEFVSAYLRDAPFAEARFAQRVAQALGRCNRGESDRAVYLLTDPEFLGRFSQQRTLGALPQDVYGDVYAALERADRGFAAGLADAERFLAGEDLPAPPPPERGAAENAPATADDEVNGMLALWREDYGRAAALFDRVAEALAGGREHRAFWLAMRALALHLAARYGNTASATQSRAALRAAASAGAVSTFFTRLRLAEARLAGLATPPPTDGQDELFSAWDRLIDRHGAQGPRFERWSAQLVENLRGDDHDAIARAIADTGSMLLGLPAAARQATSGEEDAYWEFTAPRRMLSFEVKLAPVIQRVVNDDVEQAEGATRALESGRGHPARGLLITPHEAVDATAVSRLDRVRLMNRDVFADQVERLLALVREYRRGWSDDAAIRASRRAAVEPDLPTPGWLWRALELSSVWVETETLVGVWCPVAPL